MKKDGSTLNRCSQITLNRKNYMYQLNVFKNENATH